eukprot:TRINITY_DN165_c1_g1_i1.p1 TRINITY_DN165_c1_g1~~TRINITY_DN165_c1_g1_i1.p1  ORF type:complete len:171 (+),score=111.11 TRINITY_DN165_c1_g1_i1:154-666(+)
MGRGRSSSGGRSSGRTTTTSSSSTAPRNKPVLNSSSKPVNKPVSNSAQNKPSTSTPAANNTARPPATSAPAPAPAQSSGFLGGIMQIAAGTAAGHVIGSGISNAIFGSRHSENATEAAAAPAPTSSSMQDSSMRCMNYKVEFDRCLKENNNDISTCQFAFSQFQNCQNLI